jgi:hypothetical protein
MDMYHAGPSTLVPDGLMMGSPRGMGTTSWTHHFPTVRPDAGGR